MMLSTACSCIMRAVSDRSAAQPEGELPVASPHCVPAGDGAFREITGEQLQL